MQFVESNSNSDNKASVRVHIDNTRETTTAQLNLLCHVLNQVMQPVYSPRGMEGSDVPEDLRGKATSTAMGVLHQIDNIVDDMKRWGCTPTPAEVQYVAMLKASRELQEAQALKARSDTLPHNNFPVHYHLRQENLWGAYLVQNGSATLIASGPTLYDAQRNFDQIALSGELEKSPRRRKKKSPKKATGPSSDESSGSA